MKGNCRLCGNEGNLEESHFIPKFIGKWLKKTSITGFLRAHNEPHKRAQDTAKAYLLCEECEDKFSVWETLFSQKIFHPFVSGNKSEATYESWMSKFCASLSWRTLIYICSKNPIMDKPQSYYDSLDEAGSHLSNYLLGRIDNLNQFEQHLFPLDAIESTSSQQLPPNINRYFLRTIAMDIIGNESNLFIYTKLPHFILFSFIKCKEPGKMRPNRVALKHGTIGQKKYYWPDGFIDYIFEKANTVSETYDSIPKEQQERIEQYIKENPEKARNSKTFEALLHDYNLFGDDIFR